MDVSFFNIWMPAGSFLNSGRKRNLTVFDSILERFKAKYPKGDNLL
jgi:hypothetical protein